MTTTIQIRTLSSKRSTEKVHSRHGHQDWQQPQENVEKNLTSSTSCSPSSFNANVHNFKNNGDDSKNQKYGATAITTALPAMDINVSKNKRGAATKCKAKTRGKSEE
uniref:Uncharacterized protein n=1 Tax=Glossina austeni TaxID=7395 RepID=A0A1A9VNV7_GLOAU